MAERSFVNEVQKLRLGAGDEFHGEGILAVTKALLQAGVAYVGGYQGAPISHLMDVLADSQDIMSELGIHFEHSANEATAGAMLAASVNYPLRGAVAWKSVVGTNVASDALANVASSGVRGGALIIIGEDYGEGSSIMQERTYAFAMKSQVWLLDPRPNLASIVDLVEKGFELSEASNSPVMLELRIRACHLHGRFIAKDNSRPKLTVRQAMDSPVRDTNRIVLPPMNFLHEREKTQIRWPAAIRFIQERQLNEFFPGNGRYDDLGIIVPGGTYNTLIRALAVAGYADDFGNSDIPIYVLNVTYPLVDSEVASFCSGKRAVLIAEEGQPEFIEHALSSMLFKARSSTRLVGKEMLPRAGEYTAQVLFDGIDQFMQAFAGRSPAKVAVVQPAPELADLPRRVPGFCTGCPERPIFTAMKLLMRETGEIHVSCDIGCHLFSILPPFHIGNTTMGYGLGWAAAAAFNSPEPGKRTISVMGDGGFWHNGLTSGVGNAVFNRNDNILVLVDNGYSAATGGQDILSSLAFNRSRSTKHKIRNALQGIGVTWQRTVRTYDVPKMLKTLREAMNTDVKGPKVIIAESECMLNKQRRVKPIFARTVREGKRATRVRFGVDHDTCTGDHSCIRLSGCPSLTIKPNPDPLRLDPVAHVDNSCVGCGLCGTAAHAAVLCPSFYRAQILYNPTVLDRILHSVRKAVIGSFQARDDRRRQAVAF
jgi:indolepyruvate ferredoxin oxidoreductase alpha subunit